MLWFWWVSPEEMFGLLSMMFYVWLFQDSMIILWIDLGLSLEWIFMMEISSFRKNCPSCQDLFQYSEVRTPVW
jgi:hypothetical protein